MLGQVIRRSEKDNQSGGDPHEIWHRFSGRQMGYVGNNGNYDVTYYTSRHQRQTPGSPGPGSFADFDLAHDHINSYEQGSSGGIYTVRSGDTLEGIAAGLWGLSTLTRKCAKVDHQELTRPLRAGAGQIEMIVCSGFRARQVAIIWV